MKVAIIIPVYNRKETTLSCLKQLSSIDYGEHIFDVVVVDDGSTDGTSDAVQVEFPRVTVLKDESDLWWTGAINKGVKWAVKEKYDGVFLLNDDLDLSKNFLCPIFELVEKKPGALISGLKLIKNEVGNDVVATGGFREKGWLDELYNVYQGRNASDIREKEFLVCDALTGAALYIPSMVFHKIGFLDEKKFPHNWGDIEFTLRASRFGIDCLVAIESHVYTDPNPNYPRDYFLSSKRAEYLKHIIDGDKKYYYGVDAIWKRAFMHRSVIKGLALFSRGTLGLFKKAIIKIVIPKSVIYNYYQKN